MLQKKKEMQRMKIKIFFLIVVMTRQLQFLSGRISLRRWLYFSKHITGLISCYFTSALKARRKLILKLRRTTVRLLRGKEKVKLFY